MRAKRRVEGQRQRETGEAPKKYECPVYLCKCKYHTEEELLSHYNKEHADLVELGLQLRRSKKAKRELKRRKLEEGADQILLDGGQHAPRKKDKKKSKEQQGDDNAAAANNEASAASSGDSSCSSSDSEEAEETRERTRGALHASQGKNDSHDDYKYDEMKHGNNHKDIFGHGTTDNALDVLEADSDLDDLRELE